MRPDLEGSFLLKYKFTAYWMVYFDQDRDGEWQLRIQSHSCDDHAMVTKVLDLTLSNDSCLPETETTV